MGRSFDAQSKFSERAFRELVWPAISEMCGGGELRSLESERSPLDTRGGIDGYQVFRTGVRTLAQRTQRLDDYEKPRTFTIRDTLSSGGITEMAKRLDALEKGYDLPAITIQGYVLEKAWRFVRAGVVHTRPFYQWVLQPGFREGPPARVVQRASWPPYGVTRHEPPFRDGPRELMPIEFGKKRNGDDGNTFAVVPWEDLVMYSEVPFATTDGLVVARSPREFFDGRQGGLI